ncbi:EAL and HDOD domain-containing protein [Nocardioides campestrisoli]|uniref:EAL and HDOD domain-containing protein n=1 Tax=Nocardioides campestrisoli TaxID=2736757 RepID=UPI0015E6BF21|nr:HDOD domain-containing protein [Nocardioides campestrisoli]
MIDPLDEAPVLDAVVVARVPVVDGTSRVIGFELVNRTTRDPLTEAPADPGQAVVTVSSLLASVDVDLAPVVGEGMLFCAVDRAVLVSETRLSLPPRRTVLEVPTGDVDTELLDAVRSHKRAGFMIMVEHTAWTEESEALLALADLVKIDLKSGEPADVMDVAGEYADADLERVAAGCDTEAEFAWAQAVGFDLFIGRAVRVHETTSGSASAPLPLSQVQLSVELLSEDLDLDRIEDVLRGDPALIVQLLNMASSGAGGGLRREVRSLREALVVMGTTRLRQWAALVILSRHCHRPSDALVTALVRGRMCELLARSRGVDAPFAFTAGLLSALHILLGVPSAEVEEQIKVGEELTAAAFRREGVVGELINRVEDHEHWLVGSQVPEDHDEVTLIGAMAFGWAASYAEAMDSAGRP